MVIFFIKNKAPNIRGFNMIEYSNGITAPGDQQATTIYYSFVVSLHRKYKFKKNNGKLFLVL
jgi:hypothetical protein